MKLTTRDIYKIRDYLLFNEADLDKDNYIYLTFNVGTWLFDDQNARDIYINRIDILSKTCLCFCREYFHDSGQTYENLKQEQKKECEYYQIFNFNEITKFEVM